MVVLVTSKQFDVPHNYVYAGLRTDKMKAFLSAAFCPMIPGIKFNFAKPTGKWVGYESLCENN